MVGRTGAGACNVGGDFARRAGGDLTRGVGRAGVRLTRGAEQAGTSLTRWPHAMASRAALGGLMRRPFAWRMLGGWQASCAAPVQALGGPGTQGRLNMELISMELMA
ncbi:hypothetical protein PR202_gb29950 [Eleusine coracana subsp. coracana]|uniref:Uncharacterized protein n=1 Tax=Eleusine coracana subsp. coracana TaxID=191504 RepID=A0AAV5FYE0_ELECO|nr:hypothetical protein PR202_gb29950 [Eleusine coracana subsp. coracana]